MMKRSYFIMPVLLGTLLLAACSPKVEIRGYVKDADWGTVVAGQTTKDQVIMQFGSPSSQSSFGGESWYYISSREETTAFFAPDVVEQQVVRITFNEGGVVSKVENFDKNSGKAIDIVKRTTPTEGHSMNAVEQLLGNIGRFNSPAQSGVAGSGHKGPY